MPMHSRIELEFGSVGVWGDGKTRVPGKKLSEQSRELTTNSTHIWCRVLELNPRHTCTCIGGRRSLSPLHHPCSPVCTMCIGLLVRIQFCNVTLFFRYDGILRDGLPDWRQPVFYYRRVRKMGLIEFTLLIFLILTIGHYIVAWSIYLEKKFELVCCWLFPRNEVL